LQALSHCVDILSGQRLEDLRTSKNVTAVFRRIKLEGDHSVAFDALLDLLHLLLDFHRFSNLSWLLTPESGEKVSLLMQVEGHRLVGKLGDPQGLGEVIPDFEAIVALKLLLDYLPLLNANRLVK
jgi:hypothetical protein